MRMKRHYIRICWAIMLLLGGVAASWSADPPKRTDIAPPKDILFIGNSFTYYNNSVHNRVRNLMKAGGKEDGIIRAMTISGAKLVEHAPAIMPIVKSEKWDVVVLQGHSLETFRKNDKKLFQRASRKFHEVIGRSGAETVFFMTWAYEDEPGYTEALNRGYTNIGNELDALVVPVGLAFALATERHADIRLRTTDKKHPTLAGTYLAACTFYAAFFKESPEGLSYEAGLRDGKAEKLQAIAWATVEAYYGSAE